MNWIFTSKIKPARYLQVGNFGMGFTTSSKFLFLVVLSALIDLETWWYCSRNRPETEPFAAVAVHIRYRYTIQPVYSVISVYRGKLCWQKRTMFIKAYIHLHVEKQEITIFYWIRNRKVLPLKKLICPCRHFRYLNGVYQRVKGMDIHKGHSIITRTRWGWGVKKCLFLSTQGGVVKKWQNSVHLVTEWPPT